MKTLFDLFSSHSCIGCNKLLKTYNYCDCFKRNDIIYCFADVDNDFIYYRLTFYKRISNLIKAKLYLRRSDWFFSFILNGNEHIFDFPEKEYESNEYFILHFNDIVKKTYNNLIFI